MRNHFDLHKFGTGILMTFFLLAGFLSARTAELDILKDTNTMVLSWPDQGPGMVYTLQHVSDLNRPHWTPLFPWDDWPITATSFRDPVRDDAARFYRLAVTERGRIISVTFQDSASADILNLLVIPSIESEYGIDIPFSAAHDVDSYRVEYETLDGLLGPTTASGVVFIPRNNPQPSALLSYQHGTVHRRVDAPSGTETQERLIGFIMASDGYVVAMADYLSLGPGSTGLHPYVHRRTSATAIVDMIRATRTAVATDTNIASDLPLGLSDKLFLFGYSQGAYVTLAAQQEIEQKHAAEFQITASAPSDGPYDLSGTMAEIMTSTNAYASPNYLPYVLLSYNEIYRLFDHPAEVLLEPYATDLPPLFDGEHTGGEIDAVMPASGVPSEILRPEYLEAFSNDPNHPFRLLLMDNDLTGWAPSIPTRLFHCRDDDVVPYANSAVAHASFIDAGADPARVQLIDPNPTGTHGTCLFSAVPLIIQWFESLR